MSLKCWSEKYGVHSSNFFSCLGPVPGPPPLCPHSPVLGPVVVLPATCSGLPGGMGQGQTGGRPDGRGIRALNTQRVALAEPPAQIGRKWGKMGAGQEGSAGMVAGS